MKKSVIILMLAGFFFVSGFAQTAPKIQRAYAYYSMSIPGMAMQDDNGNTIDPVITIDRIIYVESPGTKMPDIRSVSYNKVEYKVVVSRVNERIVHVGKRAENGKEIMLSARRGSIFWKLDLQLMKETDKAPREVKYIDIWGRADRRVYNFHLYNETKLLVPDRY